MLAHALGRVDAAMIGGEHHRIEDRRGAELVLEVGARKEWPGQVSVAAWLW